MGDDGEGDGPQCANDQQEDGTETTLKPRDLEKDSSEWQEITAGLDPQLLESVVSTFSMALPHGLQFMESVSLGHPSLTFGLSKAYAKASDLIVLHQSKDGAAWEVLHPHIEISENGKRASFQIRSFSNYAVADQRLAQCSAPPVAPRPRPKLATGFFAGEDSSDSATSDDDSGTEREALSGTTTTDAYFTAFAPPRIFPDGTAFLLDVTAFALEYSAVVVEGAADRGKSAASAKQRPVPIAVGTKMSVHLELPSQAFHCEEGSEVLVWDGMHSTAVFEVACLNQAEPRRHVCKAMIGIAGQEDRVVLRFELNVVADNRVLSPPASGLSSPTPELAEVPGSTTLLPEVHAQRPHIFISYRRTHFELADRVRRQLQTYGYRCFFDLDPQSGLGAGDFQTQLESSLCGVPYLLAIITPAPSGEDDVRRGLSYTECIRHYAKQGWTDYCHVELAMALADARTEVIPLFHPEYRNSDYGVQLGDLPADIVGLAAKNAKPIGDAALFDKSIEAVHELIQRHVAASIHREFQHDLEWQLSSLSVDRSPPEGVPPRTEAEPEPEQ